MAEIVAFVEGSMERAFFNTNFRYVRLVPVSNGVSWTISAIVDEIIRSLTVLGYIPEYLVVWIDRENRAESAENIANYIEERLIEFGIPKQAILIMICDKMSENVILSDEALIRDIFDNQEYSYSSEGKGGKHILKEMYRSLSINYKEMFHGVNLLKRVRLQRSRLVSPSVDRFFLNGSPNCWWLN